MFQIPRDLVIHLPNNDQAGHRVARHMWPTQSCGTLSVPAAAFLVYSRILSVQVAETYTIWHKLKENKFALKSLKSRGERWIQAWLDSVAQMTLGSLSVSLYLLSLLFSVCKVIPPYHRQEGFFHTATRDGV